MGEPFGMEIPDFQAFPLAIFGASHYNDRMHNGCFCLLTHPVHTQRHSLQHHLHEE